MTTDLALAYVESLPRVRAQRLLDGATAAIARFQPATWWNALESVANEEDVEVVAHRRRSSPISINGVGMPVREAKLQIAQALGAGFSEGQAA
jgi:hypothetical protein